MADQQLDSIVLAVIDLFKSRAAFGKQKYGTDLDRTDLKPLDWIQHAQEELMDGILYLQKLKTELKNTNPLPPQLPRAPSQEEILQKSLQGNGC
jgi:hypothetical protein